MLDDPSKSSPVFLGGTQDDLIRAHATGPVQSTPMPPHGNSTFYYLSFKGITVGKTRLPVDESVFAFKGDGTGGTFIDSGTGLTSFPTAVFDQLATAFKTQIRLPVVDASEVGGRLCFSLPDGTDEKKVPVPKLVFHFAGADMDLPRENYFYVYEADAFMCLMILDAEGDTTTIGNFQQQNMHIVYDVHNNKLLFAPAQCDKL
ncbi:hypothetical protein QOZ80_6BG0464960 [Eleusine coracana subsp. coracana]|nr:hypothetical protein QOZ80_6BG0464960 [Eleusine coracana subsp. coracana]